MNNEQQELLGDAYENWCKQFEVDPNNFNGEELANGHNDQCWGYPILDHVKPTSKEYKRGQINAYLEGKAEQPFFYLTQEEFINKCKNDTEFSERWGLQIEERELSLDERVHIFNSKMIKEEIRTQIATIGIDKSYWKKSLEVTKHNIPTRAVTITYKDKSIESYE